MIFLILLLGLILRLININQSLWLDEAINISYAQKFDLPGYLTSYLLGDFHPPLYFAVLWIWTHIFGFSEIASRMPSLIFGLGTIFVTYLIGRQYSKNVGLISALLLSFAPLHIYYSQEARPYALAAFSVTVCSYFFLKFLKSNSKISLVLAISLSLVLYSDYVAYFIFPAHFIYLFATQKKKVKNYLYSLAIGVALFLPWLFVFPSQIKNGLDLSERVTGWKEVVGGTNIKEFALLWIKTLIGRITFENKLIYIILVSVTSAVYLYVFQKVRKDFKQFSYLTAWCVVPPILAFLFSFFIPVFSYFRLLYILPAFYLLLSLGIEKFSKKTKWIILAGILLIQLSFSLAYLLNTDHHREDWKSAAYFAKNTHSDNSIVLFKNSEVPAPFRYYTTQNFGLPAQEKIPALSSKDLVNFEKIMEGKNQVVLFEYLKEITDPAGLVESQLNLEGFNLSKTFDFRGVGFVHIYEKVN